MVVFFLDVDVFPKSLYKSITDIVAYEVIDRRAYPDAHEGDEEPYDRVHGALSALYAHCEHRYLRRKWDKRRLNRHHGKYCPIIDGAKEV